MPNPIKDVATCPVQAYATSRYVEVETVEDGLAAINRETLAGLRDYAVLAVALSTERRASNLAGLRGQDVLISGQKLITLAFHCKRDKIMRNRLDEENSAIVLDYLQAQFGIQGLTLQEDAPIWVYYSRRNKGQPISAKTLARIRERPFATSKVHALHHTFAYGMIKSDASLTDLAGRLGYTDITLWPRIDQ